MTTHNVSSIIVEYLKKLGMTNFYCLPGVQNDDFFNVLYDHTDEFEVIVTRHEQGAGYMALGAAIATGKPQPYCVVPGEGMLNASTAMATAYSVYAPVFALIGQIPTPVLGKNYGSLHELPDQLAILSQLSKHAAGVYDAETAPETIHKAMTELVSGVPRPVSLEVPMDIWAADVSPDVVLPPIEKQLPALDEDAIKEAAKLLGEAERPLIFLGGGAQDASEPIRELVDLVQAPFTSNRTGRGVVDDRHPLAASWPMAHELWKSVDVVVAIGTRFLPPQSGWGLDDDIKVIQINIDPTEIGRQNPVAVGIVGDAHQSVTRLVDETAKVNKKRESREPELASLRSEIRQKMAFLEPQLSFLSVIRSEMPENGILVKDLTQVGFTGQLAYPVYKPRTFISAGYAGTLGWGYATALGVQHAMPDKKTLLVSGDGGFLYTSSEIATAVKYNIPLTAIVFRDDAYGNVKRIQQRKFDGRTIASDLVNPDFVKLAEAFGAVGMRANSPDELRPVLREALDTNAPTIIEVPVGEMPSQWEFILMPRVRGEGESQEF